MKTLSLTFTAGQIITVDGVGSQVYLLATSSGVDIEFLQNGNVISAALAMEFGFYHKPKGGYTQLRFTSAAAQTIKVMVGQGDGGYNRSSGVVVITNVAGVYTELSLSVTNASQLISASNLNRRAGLIQNNSAVAALRVTLDGSAATAAHGVRIMPGGFLQIPDFATTSAVNAMMETADATAANVEFIEG